ncbi:MAG: hypothetical protein EA397_03195 [Deltaproteobacteria bacterium]|nr:MAG: hypothetical protein EA397_03195 [Deltaproteobacteria bacterium]
MSARIFVVLATFVVGCMLCVGLVVFEYVPEPSKEREKYEVEDRFLDMRFTPATRRVNLSQFGLPERVVSEALDRITQIQQRDRDGNLLEAMKGAPSEAGVLCRNAPPLPSRYAVTGILLSGERGKRREVVPFDRVRNRIQVQESYRAVDLQAMYEQTEIQPNAQPDAYPMNIAALLMGQEVDRLTGDGDWGGTLMGPPSLVAYLNRNAEVEADLVEFFAQMHYLHEVAREPKNEFCGVRINPSERDRE